MPSEEIIWVESAAAGGSGTSGLWVGEWRGSEGRNSYKEDLVKLQTLRTQEEPLLKSLAGVRQQILESTSKLATSKQQAKDQCEAIKLASQQFAHSPGQKHISTDACAKYNGILSECKTVTVQLLNSS
ncbi:hypothetical protein RHMOL_Rhmol10G0041500 [Rhododendron molle]|uniref:Uncharacterized protein n=1 Tax=Rhododendron molle TaxID=49168 RepID=A0ACC0LZT5_RHOML|nr:hypothetical protein RHMOL_Rhmol10G0041500 [Rhododendron molle]